MHLQTCQKAAFGEASSADQAEASTQHLLALEEAVDSFLQLVLKVDTVTPTKLAEAKLAKTLDASWKQATAAGLNPELTTLLAKPFNKVSINKFVASLGIRASRLSRAQIDLLKGRVRQIYSQAKRLTAKASGVKFSLAQKDLRAISAINKQQVFWIKTFYSEHLSERIRAVSNDVLLQQGLGRMEAGKALQQALQQELGLKAGGKSAFAAAVPARFAGNPTQYFASVASTAAHQARTFGKLVVFQEAGIETFRLINPDDERTGSICQQMSGQTFSVKAGVDKMGEILAADSPGAVKSVAPWLSGSEIKDVIGGAKTGSPQASTNLQNAGVVLPPFHSFCRTEPVSIAFSPGAVTANPAVTLEQAAPPVGVGTPEQQAFDFKNFTPELAKQMSNADIKRIFSFDWSSNVLTFEEIKQVNQFFQDHVAAINRVWKAAKTDPALAQKALDLVTISNKVRPIAKIFKFLDDAAFVTSDGAYNLPISATKKKALQVLNTTVKKLPTTAQNYVKSNHLEVLFDSRASLRHLDSEFRSADTFDNLAGLYWHRLFSADRIYIVADATLDSSITAAHELGHFFDDRMFQGRLTRLFRHRNMKGWTTDYGLTNKSEDVAETFGHLFGAGSDNMIRNKYLRAAKVKSDVLLKIFASNENMVQAQMILAEAEETRKWAAAIKKLQALQGGT